jgi:hypothetical protein
MDFEQMAPKIYSISEALPRNRYTGNRKPERQTELCEPAIDRLQSDKFAKHS